MPTRFVTAAAVALAVVCPAYADTNVTVRSAHEEPAVDERPTPDAFRVGDVLNGRIVKTTIKKDTVTIEVAGITRSVQSVEVPLAFARDRHVTGMRVTIGKETVRAEMLSANAGHDQYFEIVKRGVDPALLEHVVSTETSNQLALRVFPVTETQHATVTLELGRGDASVDDQQSLFATATVPVLIFCGGPRSGRHIDKSSIRQYVKLQLPRLRYCYQRALYSNSALAGTADMHFTIERDGTVDDVSVDGTLDSETVKQCIAADVATWQLSPTDEATKVNYPLTFTASEY